MSDLFSTPVFEVRRVKPSRPKVAVPVEILDQLRTAGVEGKRIIWPVRDALHFEAMAAVLYSAGDELNASILPAPVVEDEGVYTVVKDVNNATHVRVTVGKRRGKKPASADAA